jgi:Uma2 family endonuclease
MGTSRIPDVAVILTEEWEAMQDREAIVFLNSPSPLLIVEVLSPSTIQDDYRAKHSEYSVLEIPEYWIIDIAKQVITICLLVDGRYDDRKSAANQTIAAQSKPKP